jgi:hypothetical protein
MSYCRFFLLLLVPFSALFFTGCRPYYLSVCQEWVDVRYLASFHAGTPDPRQAHPPIGQKLILDWRVPKEIFKRKPEVVLDLILWDYTTRQIRIPIESRMDYATYKLLNEEYEKTGGILTYKAIIVTEDGKIFREWKHQLWVNLITIDQETPASPEEKAALAE